LALLEAGLPGLSTAVRPEGGGSDCQPKDGGSLGNRLGRLIRREGDSRTAIRREARGGRSISGKERTAKYL